MTRQLHWREVRERLEAGGGGGGREGVCVLCLPSFTENLRQVCFAVEGRLRAARAGRECHRSFPLLIQILHGTKFL